MGEPGSASHSPTPSADLTSCHLAHNKPMTAYYCSRFRNEEIESPGVPVICLKSCHCFNAELSFHEGMMSLVEVAELTRTAAPKLNPNDAIYRFNVWG